MNTKIVILICLGMLTSSATLVLPAVKHTSESYGLVWIQGASCTPESYIPLLEEIQRQFQHSLWVSVPDFPLHTPEPVLIGSKVSEAVSAMQEQGLPVGAGLFHGGHSLGSVMIQDYLNSDVSSLGVILHGGFIQRKYVSLQEDGTHHVDLSVPTVTIGGELDGLTRVSRIAESYYTQIVNGKQAQQFPVVVVKGVSHAQFLSGTPPSFVQSNDLLPEVTETQAHVSIAMNTVAFMNSRLGLTVGDIDTYTTQLLGPMVESLLLEGYNNFRPPCYGHEIVNPTVPTCQHGSDWTEVAQRSLAGLQAPTTIHVDSNYHRVESVTPVHLPTILNDCDGKSACVLESLVVVEAAYDTLLPLDTGLQMISASELKTKLVSRQRALSHAGVKADFNVTDSPNLCAQANQLAIDWALAKLPKETLQRYLQYGQHMRVGADKGPYNAGPLWIWTYMEYVDEKDGEGNAVLTVKAPMMKTPLDYLVSAAAGFHYCKLLSPARVAEWIYVDGLRKTRSYAGHMNEMD